LQPNSLKLGSCKFNNIINIINITLRSGVADKLNTLRYSFAESVIESDNNAGSESIVLLKEEGWLYTALHYLSRRDIQVENHAKYKQTILWTRTY